MGDGDLIFAAFLSQAMDHLLRHDDLGQVIPVDVGDRRLTPAKGQAGIGTKQGKVLRHSQTVGKAELQRGHNEGLIIDNQGGRRRD